MARPLPSEGRYDAAVLQISAMGQAGVSE